MAKKKVEHPTSARAVSIQKQETKPTIKLEKNWFPSGASFPDFGSVSVRTIDRRGKTHLQYAREELTQLKELTEWIDLLKETTFKVSEKNFFFKPFGLPDRDVITRSLEETINHLRRASKSIRVARWEYTRTRDAGLWAGWEWRDEPIEEPVEEKAVPHAS